MPGLLLFICKNFFSMLSGYLYLQILMGAIVQVPETSRSPDGQVFMDASRPFNRDVSFQNGPGCAIPALAGHMADGLQPIHPNPMRVRVKQIEIDRNRS